MTKKQTGILLKNYYGTGGERSAFDLLNMFDEVNFKIIFVTAHSHYAIKAIKFSAIDFLLKPVEASDLIESTKKAIKEINYNHQAQYKGLVFNPKEFISWLYQFKTGWCFYQLMRSSDLKLT